MEKEYYKYNGVKVVKAISMSSNSPLEKEIMLLVFEGVNGKIEKIAIPTAKLYYLIIKNINNPIVFSNFK